MSKKCLVTTIDNPFNPFTHFDEWNDYDMAMGYHTCSYLARVAKTSIELSEEEQEQAINDAVEEIVRLNVNGLYKKVVMDDGD
jgi:hypothetical protein